MTTDHAGSLDVLLVEDNPGDVHMVREAFEGSDVDASLTVVTDGEAATDYLLRRGDYESAPRPNLAFLDLNLPKLNGGPVLEEMAGHADLQSVSVAVLSSSESEADVRETRELGADGYFVKPVDPMAFISLVQRVIETVAEDGRAPPGRYDDLEDAS